MNKFKSLISCTVVFCLALTSCAVGPDYKQPPMTPPSEFMLQEVLVDLGAAQKAGEFPANWWEGFSDPLLNELVAEALERNYRIEAAVARLKAARAGLKLADATNNLRADLISDPSIAKEVPLDENEKSTNFFDVFGRLTLLLPLDLFGRTARRVDRAEAGIEAAQAALRGEILAVSSDVTAEYLRLRGNQRQLELLRESVALQEKTLAIVKSRFDSGLSPELDLRRAETSVERLRAGIPRLEEALINSRNRLATLTGDYPGVYEKRLSEVQEIPVYQKPVPNLMPMNVLRMRPDVYQSEAVLKQAIAQIGVAKAEYYPDFNIAGQLSIGTSGFTGSRPEDVLVAAASALITEAILDGGTRKANVLIAEAQAEEALALYKQTLLLAVQEVETSLTALMASAASQDSLEKAVHSSSRSFDQAETLYREGLISFLDVVDAQRVLADAEQALAAERTNYATQIAVLFRTLGTEIPVPLPKAPGSRND